MAVDCPVEPELLAVQARKPNMAVRGTTGTCATASDACNLLEETAHVDWSKSLRMSARPSWWLPYQTCM